MWKLYFEGLKMLFRKFVLGQNTGKVIKQFCEKMGIVYIKLAQILTTQNYGNIFSEKDRVELSALCDRCNPIPFSVIKKEIEGEYQKKLDEIFTYIHETPIGSASVSQVHKAVLKSGEVVAVKVKRKDITATVEADIANIRKLVNRWGPLFRIKNLLGGNKALDYYIKWIRQEVDFHRERENILRYQQFADSVNGKVEGTKNIRLPKLYSEFCTENIIVMEYIEHPTIAQLELNEENKRRIQQGINDYIKLSFHSFFNHQPLVFHGDPHGGNIYLDENGNIGFFDMGLLFELTQEETSLLRNFFLAAYTGDAQKLCDLLLPYGHTNEKERLALKQDIIDFCEFIKDKPVTMYFVDMIGRVLKYNFDPPEFLYTMAKPFLCLNGINCFTENGIDAVHLLQEQVVEYFICTGMEQTSQLLKKGIQEGMDITKNMFEKGLANTMAKMLTNQEYKQEILSFLENGNQFLRLVQSSLKQ